MSIPNAATRYAALVALEAAIAAEKKKAAADAAAAADLAGLTKGTVDTPFGPVTLRENKGSRAARIEDEPAFLEWVRENLPGAIETVPAVERVRVLDRAALLADRFAVVAGAVVDSTTGAIVDFAEVAETPAGPPTPSYGPSDRQKEAKRAAAEWVAEKVDALVASTAAQLEAADVNA